MRKRMSQKRLERLPETKLFSDKKDKNGKLKFVRVRYYNAPWNADVPLILEYFKPNGRGLPWACGVSNACHDNKTLFNHPVLMVYTKGTAVYIVIEMEEGGMTPRLAVRYNHNYGKPIDAFDAGEDISAMLVSKPILHLLAGKSQAGIAKKYTTSGTPGGNHDSEKNQKNVTGAAKRFKRAGVIFTEAEVD